MKERIKYIKQRIRYYCTALIPHVHVLQNVIYIAWIGYDFYIKR